MSPDLLVFAELDVTVEEFVNPAQLAFRAVEARGGFEQLLPLGQDGGLAAQALQGGEQSIDVEGGGRGSAEDERQKSA